MLGNTSFHVRGWGFVFLQPLGCSWKLLSTNFRLKCFKYIDLFFLVYVGHQFFIYRFASMLCDAAFWLLALLVVRLHLAAFLQLPCLQGEGSFYIWGLCFHLVYQSSSGCSSPPIFLEAVHLFLSLRYALLLDRSNSTATCSTIIWIK